MSPFKTESNVSARSRQKVLEIVRKSAKNIGMVAEKITAVKRGAMRVGGKQVWHIEATFRTRKKRKRRKK